jgi:tetraacyldisaccharide 4'-kinase
LLPLDWSGICDPLAFAAVLSSRSPIALTVWSLLNPAASLCDVGIGIARALERGDFDGRLGRALSAQWGRVATRTLARSLDLYDKPTVAIGGATLGGSGKTPLAIACARFLADSGARVAFVGHAYRAHPRHARVVKSSDALADVGDEALLAARALLGTSVTVVVAPRRADAVAFASRCSDVIVLDGVAQTAPDRASLALLAVDAQEPWGRSHNVPPSGDLRAPVDALLSACDAVVAITDPQPGRQRELIGGSWEARARSRGVWLDRKLVSWDRLAGARVGLVCALARPHRVWRFVEARGVSVRAIVRAPDHGPFRLPSAGPAPGRLADKDAPDMWLATAKCAIHLAAAHAARKWEPRLTAVIDYAVSLGPELGGRLRRLGSP